MNKHLTNLLVILNILSLLSLNSITNAMEQDYYSQEATAIARMFPHLDLAITIRKNFLSAKSLEFNSTNSSGNVRKRIALDIEALRSLVESETERVFPNKVSATALLSEINEEHIDLKLIEVLLEHGASISSACWIAAWKREEKDLFLLLRRHLYNRLAHHAKEQDLELLNKSLWIGLQRFCLAHVHSLLKRKADVKAPLSKNKPITPLQYAIQKQHCGLVSLLLRSGANPDTSNERTGKTYLDEAIELWHKNKNKNSERIYMLLVLHGGHFSPPWVDNAPQGALEAAELYASAYSNPQKLLRDAIIEGVHHKIIHALEAGAQLDKEAPDNSERIYDHLRELFVDTSLMVYLLQQERALVRTFSPLMLAIRYRQLGSAETLLDKKAPITENCMKLAKLYRYTDMIELLEKYKKIRERDIYAQWWRDGFNFDLNKARTSQRPRATSKTSSNLRLSSSSDRV